MPLPSTMNAISIESPGMEARLVLKPRAMPKPGAGQVLIKVHAAGLNRGDLLQSMGLYPPPKGTTDVPGLEAAGEIAVIGAGVTMWKPGDKVAALMAGGGYAEYALADEGSCLPVPSNISMVEAAALPEAFFTVWTNIIDRAQLKRGETLMIHGGASGIGTTAIQIFRDYAGAIFATAGGPEKTALCVSLGATRAIDYRTEDFAAIVKAETAGRGVDVILDMVGGDYVTKNIASLAVEGRLVNIAYQNGSKVELDLMQVMLRRLTITASTLRIRTAAQKAAIAEGIKDWAWGLVEDGRFKPVIDKAYPLAEAGAAQAHMAKGTHAGKIILTV